MPETRRHSHILLQGAAKAEDYAYAGPRPKSKPLPFRDRASHASLLRAQLQIAQSEAKVRRQQQSRAWNFSAKRGIHLEVLEEPGSELALDSLDSGGLQLVAVRGSLDVPGARCATIFVPRGKLGLLERKIDEYETKNTKAGKPKNARLVAPIAGFRLAVLRSFWTDDSSLFPQEREQLWWEVWLRSAEEDVLRAFQATSSLVGLKLGSSSLKFVETRVLLAYGSIEQLTASVDLVDSIGELRRAKETPAFFMNIQRRDQVPWIADLVQRTTPPRDGAPRICIHDTGINAGHPLLEAALSLSDCHSIDPSWRLDDRMGHGTGMAGLSLYGDLSEVLAVSGGVDLAARLESVKILPPYEQENAPELYGSITEQAVYRVEIVEPSVNRVHLLAVTAREGRERGRPSSWSAAVDNLAFGQDSEPQRLWVVSAGDANEADLKNHPDHLESEEIHDPAQAWNAVAVGAFTTRWEIHEADFQGWSPLARPGELGPSTSTSLTWDRRWPIKPDVVEEGGNFALSSDAQIG